MFPTTYPKIAATGIETQPGSDPSQLLPHVCTHSVNTTEIIILFLLYYDIFSMHRPHRSVFPDVLSIYAGAFTDFGRDATRNVIAVWTATLRPCSDLTLQCPTEVNCNLLHVVIVVLCTHNIIYVQSLDRYLYPTSGNILISSTKIPLSQPHMTYFHHCTDWVPP
jgi:hypothetical protein